MQLKQLSDPDATALLKAGELCLHMAPFNVRISSPLPALADGLLTMYGDYELSQDDCWIDFAVEVASTPGLRRWIRPQVQFHFDEYTPFLPLPREQAFPMLEWGLNWCVSNHMHNYLIIHAAMLAWQGKGLIMPGSPGSGKSTLSAALMLSGWQLLSDELTLLDPQHITLQPAPRPVSLKNASIAVINSFSKSAIFSHVVTDTAKGTVAHLKPTEACLSAPALAPVIPRVVLFPKYKSDSETQLSELSCGETIMALAEQGFNYTLLGVDAFSSLCQLVETCRCFRLEYSALDEAIPLLQSLLEEETLG